jgi:hypothetical protein
MNNLSKNTTETLAKLKKILEYKNATDLQIIAHVLGDVLTLFVNIDNDLKKNPRYFSCVDESLQILASLHEDGLMLCGGIVAYMERHEYLK